MITGIIGAPGLCRTGARVASGDGGTGGGSRRPPRCRRRPWAGAVLRAAAGLAVDVKGNVFIGDLVNQEVVEISPEGKKVSATKAPWPDKVLVDSQTGVLYVSSLPVSRAGKPPAKILKVVGRGTAGKVAAEYTLKTTGETRILGSVQTEQRPDTSTRVVLAGWEANASANSRGALRPFPQVPAKEPGLPVTTVESR